MSRGIYPLITICLSVVIMALFTPYFQLANQSQFVWVVIMQVLIAYPLLQLEAALAKRAQAVPLVGIMQLTREIDASVRWRSIIWLGALLLSVLAALLLSKAVQISSIQGAVELPALWMYITFVLLALGLSFLAPWLLACLAGLSLLTMLVLKLAHGFSAPWDWVALSMADWAKATALAVSTSVLGLGLYWQAQALQFKTAVAQLVLYQVLATFIFVLLFYVAQPVWWAAVLLLMLTAAWLVMQLRTQLQQRQTPVVWQLLLIVLPMLAMSFAPLQQAALAFWPIALLWLVLALCIFVGWKMKISHLRKALNYSTELKYNLWRIVIRLGVPIVLLLASVLLILQRI